MVLDGALSATGDKNQVGDSGRDRLFDGELDDRLVDDRQQFLGQATGNTALRITVLFTSLDM